MVYCEKNPSPAKKDLSYRKSKVEFRKKGFLIVDNSGSNVAMAINLIQDYLIHV